MASDLATMSKEELRESLARTQKSRAAAAKREAAQRYRNTEGLSFIAGAVGLGFAEDRGLYPQEVMGAPTDMVLGAVALFAATRTRGRNAAVLRGLGYAAAGPGLRDLGRKLSSSQLGG